MKNIEAQVNLSRQRPAFPLSLLAKIEAASFLLNPYKFNFSEKLSIISETTEVFIFGRSSTIRTVVAYALVFISNSC